MNPFMIFTDSSADLKPDILKAWGVGSVSLSFRFTDDGKEYRNDDMPIGDFYEKMTKGAVAKTAAVNTQDFIEAMTPILAAGEDILYIGFSSGLSTTYNSARIAARELMQMYPERVVRTVDSLCASAGLGLLVRIALDKKAEGKSLDAVADYIDCVKMNICHWFTVNDLVYLKRGGRVSPAVAFVGNMLGIKPVLHVDNDGHLINVSKARGRRGSLTALLDRYTALAAVPEEGHVYISHAYCEEDANTLASMLRERHGVAVEIITDVGPVIGAHSGPGTLALFFVGKER